MIQDLSGSWRIKGTGARGFTGSFDTDLDHRSPQRNAPYVIFRVMWPEHDLAMMDACGDNLNGSVSTEADHGVYAPSDQ